MKRLTRIEKILNAKRQLSEFIKLHPEEKLKNFFKLKHSILRLYDIVFENGIPELDSSVIEKLSSDHLFMDVELIPYYIDEKNTPSYTCFKTAKDLPYPPGDYKIINAVCGRYKSIESDDVLFSHRIAIDYSLEAFARRWYESIPIFLELFEKKSKKS